MGKRVKVTGYLDPEYMTALVYDPEHEMGVTAEAHENAQVTFETTVTGSTGAIVITLGLDDVDYEAVDD